MEQLIRLLNENARLSNAQLAVMLNKTEDEVADMILEAERQGVIRGYHVLIDQEKLGTPQVTALIELQVTPKRDRGFEVVADAVMQYEEVESVYLMSGSYDLLAVVTGADFKDIAFFVARKLATLDGVKSTATHFILSRYKDRGVVMNEEETIDRRSPIL